MDIAQYAGWFRSSTPYIQTHRGKTFVLVLPGEALEHGNLVNIIHDVALLHVLGARLVMVHGARPQLDTALGSSDRSGARRITQASDLPLLQRVYGELRTRIEALFSTGLPNTPLHRTDIAVASGNLVVAKPVGVVDGVDHHFTGEVRQIHRARINALLDAGAIVLMSPQGYSPSGQLFNLASDELAAATALAIRADKLILLDDDRQIRNASGTAQSLYTATELDQRLEADDLPDATRDRLRAGLTALRGGVPRVHLVTYQEDGALLAELYTASGHGTQISEQSQTPIRTATADDIAGIVALIRPLEDDGTLVRRSRDRLETEIEQFLIAEIDGIVIGCCALYPYETSAELACVAVHHSYKDTGIGRRLLEQAEVRARSQGMTHLFALTTRARDWFVERGFTDSTPDCLPAPRQELYNAQRNSSVLEKTL